MQLREAYQERFQYVLESDSLTLENLKNSRDLFESTSLIAAKPVPRKLDTYCIVGGVPFGNHDIAKISHLIREIQAILRNCLSYLVEPQNLGVELAVLKWPDLPLKCGILDQVLSFIDRNPPPKFTIDIEGFQFHTDGCLILRGFDRNASFQEYRGRLLSDVKLMPQKQSAWCHIPLGRILTPLDPADYSLLIDCACHSQTHYRFSIQVNSLQVLHETRWYQLEKTLLKSFLAHD